MPKAIDPTKPRAICFTEGELRELLKVARLALHGELVADKRLERLQQTADLAGAVIRMGRALRV